MLERGEYICIVIEDRSVVVAERKREECYDCSGKEGRGRVEVAERDIGLQ